MTSAVSAATNAQTTQQLIEAIVNNSAVSVIQDANGNLQEFHARWERIHQEMRQQDGG